MARDYLSPNTRGLNSENELSELVFHNAQVAIVVTDKDQKIEHINPEFSRLFGYTAEEVIGRNLHDLIIPEALRSESEEVNKQLEKGERLEYETIRRRKDGRTIDVLCRVSAIFINNRQTGGFAFYSDISARKHAQEELKKAHDELEKYVEMRTEELREANERLQSEIRERKHMEKEMHMFRYMLDQTNDAIHIIDPETDRFIAFNDMACNILGYEWDEMANMKITDVDFNLINESTGIDIIRENVLKHGLYVFESSHTRKDGTTFPVEASSRLVTYDEKQYTVSVTRDITDRKQAEKELQEAKEAAEAANNAKSEFLANMSHEIRTPLNGVMGVLNLLLSTDPNSEQLDLIETGKRSADSLLTVINDILDFSKIEAGKLDLEILNFNLRNVIEEVVELPAMMAHEKGLEFIYEIHHEIPSLLRGDPGRLRQLLLNLTNNGIKFTQEGEIVVRISLKDETESHAEIRFEVKDTGIGIPKDKVGSIFESFKQSDSSTTRMYGGTGLGLSISKRLAELMNGEIGVDSEKGKGSTFWFTALFEKQPHIEEEQLAPPPDIHGKRFLLVDDSKTNLEILKRYIESWGCYCDVADSTEMALSLMNAVAAVNASYDAVIIDMRMPKMDGAELGKRIKANPILKETTMVMLTSQGLRGDAARMREIGFSAYLTKPIRRSQFFDCLVTVLGTKAKKSMSKKSQIVTKHSIFDERKRKTRVLIVEDNIVNQKLALRMIEKFGFQADAVANGKEALSALESFRYDLVLMDVQMPEMDGLEATAKIRDPQSSIIDHNVPIVAMTAHALKGDRECCIEAGMNDYVSKPIDPQELLDAIEKQLHHLGKYSSLKDPVLCT